MSDDTVVVDTGNIKEKIVHMLTIYPLISPTMLQGGLGPYVKPRDWKPLLEVLIQEGVVVRTQEEVFTPNDRFNTYTKLSLASKPE